MPSSGGAHRSTTAYTQGHRLLGAIKKVLSGRNNSILAHGAQPMHLWADNA
jgi:hypothetical protein